MKYCLYSVAPKCHTLDFAFIDLKGSFSESSNNIAENYDNPTDMVFPSFFICEHKQSLLTGHQEYTAGRGQCQETAHCPERRGKYMISTLFRVRSR